jgi:hypothetical protein
LSLLSCYNDSVGALNAPFDRTRTFHSRQSDNGKDLIWLLPPHPHQRIDDIIGSPAASLALCSPAWATPAEATPDYGFVVILNGTEPLLIMFTSRDPNSTAARRSTHFDLRDTYRQ